MRAAITLRNATKDASSAWSAHVGDTSPMWKKFREALVVNPDSGTGSPLPMEHRYPQPASRPEKFTVPSSKASDIAQNQYFNRDFRRAYPKTEMLHQDDLAALLIAQGGIASLPAPQSASEASTAIVAGSPVPTLSSIFASPTAVASPTFRPPRPPGFKYKWSVAKEVVPHDENAYFPMWMASSEKIVA